LQWWVGLRTTAQSARSILNSERAVKWSVSVVRAFFECANIWLCEQGIAMKNWARTDLEPASHADTIRSDQNLFEAIRQLVGTGVARRPETNWFRCANFATPYYRCSNPRKETFLSWIISFPMPSTRDIRPAAYQVGQEHASHQGNADVRRRKMRQGAVRTALVAVRSAD